MDGDERARLSGDTFGLLARLVHRTSQDAAAILRSEGLNPAQFQLLLAVRDDPGQPQRALVGRFAVSGANVSMLVSKLEAAGFLEREAHGASNAVWLTDAGEELVERLAPDQTTFITARFQVLDDAELEELHRLARRTWEALPPPH